MTISVIKTCITVGDGGGGGGGGGSGRFLSGAGGSMMGRASSLL